MQLVFGDDIPANLNHVEKLPLPNSPIQPNLPDFHLEKDIQIAEEIDLW